MTPARYGDVLSPAQLAAAPLPPARGALTERLFAALRGGPGPLPDDAGAEGAAGIGSEDAVLALYCLYELHYRGFADVADGWEWEPSLLAVRQRLERSFVRDLTRLLGPPPDTSSADLPALLRAVVAGDSTPSVSDHLAEHGSLAQFREFAVHRSAYQLKEADPHTWALPRLAGPAKAALVELQCDEYGRGVERDMHQTLFALTLKSLGLDPGYHAYLPLLPASTLAPVNLVSMFGLHRRWRGALVGHLAVFEMTSVEPMARAVAALRRHGQSLAAQHFYAVHVAADAHHEQLAVGGLAAGLAAQEPGLAPDIVFGARAACALEARAAAHLLDCWRAGLPSLRAPLRAASAA